MNYKKLYGVRNSELLRLPYLDIIQFHVVDSMHNMLVGNFEGCNEIVNEQTVYDIKVPAEISWIPFKIDSGFSSFTAEQWKNWTCVYSLCCLYELIPQQHSSCWLLSAATISITFENWNKLMKRCKSSLQHFETFMVYNTANETCK